MGKGVAGENGLQRGVVGKVRVFEGEAGQGQQLRQPILFELYGVIVIEAVEAHDRVTLGKQAFGKMKADESGCASDENVHGETSFAW